MLKTKQLFILRKDAKEKIGKATLEELSQLHIGNRELSVLEDVLRKKVTT